MTTRKMYDAEGNVRFPVFDIVLGMPGGTIENQVLMDGEPVGWTSGVRIDAASNEMTTVTITFPAEVVRFRGPAVERLAIQVLNDRLEPQNIDRRMVQRDCHNCGYNLGLEDRFCAQCGCMALDVEYRR